MAESKKQSDESDVEEKDDGFAWLRYLIGFPSKKKERAPELQKRAQPDSIPPITTTPQAKPMELKKASEKTVVVPPAPQELPDKSHEPFAEEFPTWLRQDLNLNESIPPIEAPVLQEDNLSWLDGIASGLGAALDEPPTMNWEESEIMLTHNAAISSRKREGTELRSPKKANSADNSIIEDDQSAPTIVAFEPSPSADDNFDIEQPTQHRIVQVSEAEELFASEIERLQDEPTSPPTMIAEPRSLSLPPVEFSDAEDGTLISPPKNNINMSEIPTDPDEAISWLENLANRKNSTAIPQLFDEDEGTHPTGEIPQMFDEIDDSFWRLPGVDDFDEDEGTYISAEPLLPQPVEDEKNFLLQGLDQDMDELPSFYAELATKKDEVTTKEVESGLNGAPLSASADDELAEIVQTAPEHEPIANVEEAPKPSLEKEPIKEKLNRQLTNEESASKLADFDEALAWLEGVSGDADSSLDEITLELDQENLAALLHGDRYPKTETVSKQLDESALSKPGVEANLGEPTIAVPGNGEPTIVSPADAAHEKTTGEEGDTTEKVESSKQSIFPTPPTNRARRQLLEKSEQHHDALAWLEAFSAERVENLRERRPNVIVGRHITIDEPTVIHLFARERLFARDAVDIGNYGEAADVYQELIDLDNKDSADAVIAELSKVVETVTDYPRFYMLLGDAYQKATHFEQAAQSYRQAALLLMPPKN